MSGHTDTRAAIYNGARCKFYCWSQSHSDLEIRIKLAKAIRYDNVDVTITSNYIKVMIVVGDIKKEHEFKTITIMEGNFEYEVSTESSYWLLDNEDLNIVIYIDKLERMWWKQLLLNEEVTEKGLKNYTILMDHLDDGSRMAVDKLIVEQRNKRTDSEKR